MLHVIVVHTRNLDSVFSFSLTNLGTYPPACFFPSFLEVGDVWELSFMTCAIVPCCRVKVLVCHSLLCSITWLFLVPSFAKMFFHKLLWCLCSNPSFMIRNWKIRELESNIYIPNGVSSLTRKKRTFFPDRILCTIIVSLYSVLHHKMFLVCHKFYSYFKEKLKREYTNDCSFFFYYLCV